MASLGSRRFRLNSLAGLFAFLVLPVLSNPPDFSPLPSLSHQASHVSLLLLAVACEIFKVRLLKFHSSRSFKTIQTPRKIGFVNVIRFSLRGISTATNLSLRFLALTRLPRKEVIQPHLPIRLPCYDLTPVATLTFDSWLLAVTSLASGARNSHGLTGGVYKARERIHRDMLIRDY